MEPSNNLSKVMRNEMEKYRRMQMKYLFSSLASHLPIQPSVERLPLPSVLDQATTYIKQLKEKVEEMRGRKEQQLKGERNNNKDKAGGSIVPVVTVRDMGSTLEVNLITGLNKRFMLYEVFSILEEEGAEVVNATYSTMGDRIFYSIHSQAFLSRIGIEISRVHKRLMQLLF